MTEQEIIEILKTNEPFEGLAGVSAIFPEDQDESQADLRFDLKFGGNQIAVYAEVKSACTPKLTQQMVAWLAKMKSLVPIPRSRSSARIFHRSLSRYASTTT